MYTRKWSALSPDQKGAAQKFANTYGVSTSQAGKYLDWFFALVNGKITPEQFERDTGHNPIPVSKRPLVSDIEEEKG